MFPFSADLECTINVPSPSPTNTEGVLAWCDRIFKLMGAEVERSTASGMTVTLPADYLQTETPNAMRHVHRLIVEVRPSAAGVEVYVTVRYRVLLAGWGLLMGVMWASLYPGGPLARLGIGIALTFGPSLFIQHRVVTFLRGVCADIERSYRDEHWGVRAT